MVVVVALLLVRLGSLKREVMLAVLEITVPAVAVGFTVTFSTRTELSSGSKVGIRSHITVPAAPTAGVVQVQFAGAVIEAKLVPAGSTSVNVGRNPVLGPALLVVIV